MSSYNKLMYHPATGMDLAERVPAANFHSDAPSDTQRQRSADNSDWLTDQKAIAARKLGVADPKDLQSEQISVDRQSLLQMLRADSIVDGMNGAEYFFDSVMIATETYILWPRDMKRDSKRSKDPQVRILGRIAEVTRAKEHILARLETRQYTRVTMKMDVSYADHSNIIGPGGKNIKRIQNNTAALIHFPDSNRFNATEKSNNVSLYGLVEGVERARVMVRLSAALPFTFELPIVPGGPQPDQNTPYVKMIEHMFGVRVTFTPRVDTVLILVKGCEHHAAQVQAATQMLMNFSCASMHHTLVQMHLQISPLHHEIVKGNNNNNILGIMEHTKTTIIFPDLWDMQVSPCKKSQVTICGSIDGVYQARQQLLGNLPIFMFFDLPDNQIPDVCEMMMFLSTKYGVFVSFSPKQKAGRLPIISIKGVEKCVSQIYEAHRELLQLSSGIVKPAIAEISYTTKDQEICLGYSPALNSPLAGRSSDSTEAQQPITATDDWNLTHFTADSTYGGYEADNCDRASFGTTEPLHNTHYDMKPTFDLDMRRASLGFMSTEHSPIISDELHAPNANWLVLDDMIRQCGDMSLNAASGAQRRHSFQ